MGAAETPINLATYVPGDPWTHGDFATLAPRTPRIIETKNSGQTSTPSYFESRVIRGATQKVTIGVSGGAADLEVSHDGGDSWDKMKSYATGTLDTIDYPNFVMLRLSVTSGTGVKLTLSQGL